MSRLPAANIPAADALEDAMKRWQQTVDKPYDDQKKFEIARICMIVGARIRPRVTSSFMTKKFSPSWLADIITFIEESAQMLHEEGGHADSLAAHFIAHIAGGRFESLEIEERFIAIARGK